MIDVIDVINLIKSDLIHFKIDSDITQCTIEKALNNNDRSSVYEAYKNMGLYSI